MSNRDRDLEEFEIIHLFSSLTESRHYRSALPKEEVKKIFYEKLNSGEIDKQWKTLIDSLLENPENFSD